MKSICSVRSLTRIGVMAAAVYAASAFLQIPIPLPIGSTRLHMGNVMCLLGGLLLGPVPGGLAAGIGSMLFDLTSPAYVTSAPFTFAFKFAMAWVCGQLARRPIGNHRRAYTLGAAAGSVTYILLYLTKAFVEARLVLGLPLEAALLTVAQKAAVSSVNGAVAVLAAVPLALALRPVLREQLR